MKTLVLGASTNTQRYAHMAAVSLMSKGHEVVLVGQRDGEIKGVKILTGQLDVDGIDTVTLYIGPQNQPAFYDYIIKINPRRVIFNPGTENPELFRMLKENKIDYELACTLVMLSIGSY